MGEGEADTPLAYDEFGVPVVQAGQSDHKSSNPFGFTGYMRDSVSGIYFAQARYYLPQAGRFNAQDAHWNSENMISGDEPFVFANLALLPHNHSIIQSANLYNYCGSNPLSFIDLTGQVFKAAIAGVGAVVGGVAGATRGVVRGIAAGESIGTVVARGAVGAVSGAAGGAVAGTVLFTTGNIAKAGAAGGATFGALNGAGNAIIDGVNSGMSAREIASSAAVAFGQGAATGAAIGFTVGKAGFGVGGAVGRTFLMGPGKAAGFTAVSAGIGYLEGSYDRILEAIDGRRDSSDENTLCPC